MTSLLQMLSGLVRNWTISLNSKPRLLKVVLAHEDKKDKENLREEESGFGQGLCTQRFNATIRKIMRLK